MKLLVAILQPEELKAVQAAIHHEDVELMTVSEVLDCCQEGPIEIYRGREVRRMASRFRLEIAVTDTFLAATIEAVKKSGCDKVFVMDLYNPLRTSHERTNGCGMGTCN